MASMVRAAVLRKPKTIELAEFSRPSIGADDALLRIEACGICGSDYEQYEGAAPSTEDYTQFPVIPGHEPLGIIEEIGARARERWGVAEGDRVAVRSGYGCGAAPPARASTRARAPRAAAPTATPTSASRRISGAGTRSTCISARTRS
jgi:threonine dehydrogenase-like Zn-dependent dehydrogenase